MSATLTGINVPLEGKAFLSTVTTLSAFGAHYCGVAAFLAGIGGRRGRGVSVPGLINPATPWPCVSVLLKPSQSSDQVLSSL